MFFWMYVQRAAFWRNNKRNNKSRCCYTVRAYLFFES